MPLSRYGLWLAGMTAARGKAQRPSRRGAARGGRRWGARGGPGGGRRGGGGAGGGRRGGGRRPAKSPPPPRRGDPCRERGLEHLAALARVGDEEHRGSCRPRLQRRGAAELHRE